MLSARDGAHIACGARAAKLPRRCGSVAPLVVATQGSPLHPHPAYPRGTWVTLHRSRFAIVVGRPSGRSRNIMRTPVVAGLAVSMLALVGAQPTAAEDLAILVQGGKPTQRDPAAPSPPTARPPATPQTPPAQAQPAP